VHALEGRIERLEAREGRWSRSVERARHAKQARARHGAHARVGARKATRERVEGVLEGRITRMMAISKERAASRFAPSSMRHLLRPTRGHLSQGYGCQVRRHGRCLGYHDGLDIAAPVGTPVRAAAEGYVAYVGWNPWDAGSRAYIVIIGHVRSLETIYAHLRPQQVVRAGQHVGRGQLIGRVGRTGHSSGPHLHWEVSRDFHTIDPRRL
jgi:murein DD-endopeptidase MepM/ murein hydrolase activator NlpD